MPDEEKKAIEYWQYIRDTQIYDGYKGQAYAVTLVNLIEKQSKEIEHQKEKRENQRQELAILNAKQIEFNKLVNTVNSYKGQFKRQQKEIEELKENNGYHLGFIDGGIAKKYEYQDKIKAKIEEVKDGTYDAKIVMQSLLEKE